MRPNRIFQYFAESFQELGKVTWPTKSRAINICIVVLSFVLVSTAVIAALDFVFHQGYSYLLTLAREVNVE